MLAENPEIVKRLRCEIINSVGLERAPTYEDLRSMKYLRAFVNGMSWSCMNLLWEFIWFGFIRDSPFVPICVSHSTSSCVGLEGVDLHNFSAL